MRITKSGFIKTFSRVNPKRSKHAPKKINNSPNCDENEFSFHGNLQSTAKRTQPQRHPRGYPPSSFLQVSAITTGEALERWVFDVHTDKAVGASGSVNKSEKEVMGEIQAIVR